MLRLLLAEKACVPQTQMLSQLQAQGGVSQAMLAASTGMPASAGLNHEAALQVRHGVTRSEMQVALCCGGIDSRPVCSHPHACFQSGRGHAHLCCHMLGLLWPQPETLALAASCQWSLGTQAAKAGCGACPCCQLCQLGRATSSLHHWLHFPGG